MRAAWARATLATLLLLSSAAAEAAAKRIGVPKFEGAQEAAVRKQVMRALKAHGYELVRSHEIKEALGRPGVGIDSSDGLKTLAEELALSAIVTGEVTSKRAKIVVRDGGDGSILGDASFSGANSRKLAKVVGLTFWKKLGPDVGRGHVPARAKKPTKSSGAASPEDDESSQGGEGEAADESGEGEAAPRKPKEHPSASGQGGASRQAATVPEKKEEEPPEGGSPPFVPSGRPWLDFELGAGGLNRSLTFSQNFTPGLLDYHLGVGPIAVANLVIYPLDPVYGGVLGNIGLEAEIQQGFATSSTLTMNGTSTTFTNVTHDYAGGVRYRIPFAAVNDVYLSGSYGEDAYAFTGRSPTNVLQSPDAIYRYVRPGLGLAPESGHHLPLRSPRARAPSGDRRPPFPLPGWRIPRRPQPRRHAVPAVFPAGDGGGRRRRARGPVRALADVRGARWPGMAALLVHAELAARRHLHGEQRGRPVVRLHGAPRDLDRRRQRPRGREWGRGGTTASASRSRRGAASRDRRTRSPAATRAAATPTSNSAELDRRQIVRATEPSRAKISTPCRAARGAAQPACNAQPAC